MLEKLFRTLSQRRKQQRENVVQGIRQLIVLTGDSEMGTEVEIDYNHFAEMVEGEGFSDEELRRYVTLYKQRVDWRRQADNLEQLEAAERLAVDSHREFDEAERKRRDAALIEIERLSLAARNASDLAQQARLAKSELMGGQNITTPELEALESESQNLNREISKLELKLNPNEGGYDLGGPSWANLSNRPALLLKQTRAALANKKVSHSAERLLQLGNQEKVAAKVVAECSAELARLRERQARVQSAAAKVSTGIRMQPENFVIVRGNPQTHDEKRKAYARRLGMHDGPSFTITADAAE